MRADEPAYPAHDYLVGDLQKDGFQKLGATRGLTIRERFIMAAMQAALTRYGIQVYRESLPDMLAAVDATLAAMEKCDEIG